jgi:hypothetical protein
MALFLWVKGKELRFGDIHDQKGNLFTKRPKLRGQMREIF